MKNEEARSPGAEASDEVDHSGGPIRGSPCRRFGPRYDKTTPSQVGDGSEHYGLGKTNSVRPSTPGCDSDLSTRLGRYIVRVLIPARRLSRLAATLAS